MASEFFHDFDEHLTDQFIALVGGMQPVISNVDGPRRVGIFVGFRVKGNTDVVGIAIVPVLAGLGVLQALVFHEALYVHVFVVVEIYHVESFGAANAVNGKGKLVQGLAILGLVGTVGVVLEIVDVHEVSALHGGNEQDLGIGVEAT